MKYKIIVDSCCDMPIELRKRLEINSVPLSMMVGGKEFIDDDELNMDNFMSEMKACTEKVGSASPSPFAYKEAMKNAGKSIIVTLSKKLSGSYNSAVTARHIAEEEGEVDAHIIDSKSASAGQTLIALKLHEMLSENNAIESVKAGIESFIDNMKTYFVLENYDNLQKNGRMNKLVGKLIQVLDIKLIMGADGDGGIALFKKARGVKQTIKNMLDLIHESGKETERLVISHCGNPDLAEKIAEAVRERFNFKEIFIVPTGGLSSLYADDKGVVIAF